MMNPNSKEYKIELFHRLNNDNTVKRNLQTIKKMCGLSWAELHNLGLIEDSVYCFVTGRKMIGVNL